MKRRRLDLVVGGALVALAVLAAITAPLVSPARPLEISLAERLLAPSSAHLLGTDELGRDVAARILFGARNSLLVGILAALAATTLGLLAAGLAWLGGRVVDGIVFRSADVLLAFPGALLAVALAALLGPGRGKLVVALSLTGWVGVARLARAQILRWESEQFVVAAESAGASRWRILGKHILPQVGPVVAVQSALLVGGFILSEGALSFLGLGIPPPEPSWGGMLDAARGHLLDAPHLALFPALALVATMVGFGLLGDGLVDRFDPQKN